jgi:hypothetical protein
MPIKIVHLIKYGIPNERFSKDVIDSADKIRKYRNHLIHQAGDSPPPEMQTFKVKDAKTALATYFHQLDPMWK